MSDTPHVGEVKISPQYVADTLSPELLTRIGEIIVRWGRLQWQLANLLVVGFEIPKDTGLAMTSTMDVGELCGTIRALTCNDRWIGDEALRDQLRQLAGDVKNKAKTRNGYAHGAFGFDMDDTNAFARYLFRASEKGEIVPSSEPLRLEEMDAHALEAKELVDRTIELTVKLKALRNGREI